MNQNPVPPPRPSSLRILSLVLLLAFMACPTAGPAQVYPPDFRFIRVPAPLAADNPPYPLISRPIPNPGESFFDLRFGTLQTRVTQSSTVRHEYSRFDPFNCNQSRLLVTRITTGDWRVYRTTAKPYDQAANLVRTINNLGEMRWDPDDPATLWGFRDLSIIRLNVETGQETLVKDFSADPAIAPLLAANPLIYRITCMDEGESSRDKRYWALSLQNGDDPDHPEWSYVHKFLFTWDRLQDKVLGTYQLSLAQGQNLDWVGMSPLGNWVVIGGLSEQGVPPAWGLMMASKDFAVLHQLSPDTAHADVGLDTQGREVIVMQNSRTDRVDLMPLDLGAKPVNSPADYNNNLIKPLVILYYNNESPLGLNSGVHISCNYPGYCLISTNIGPDLPEQNWLDRCLILVRLDRGNPQAVYLAKIYNTTAQYWEETHGTMSNDGARIIWVDNWGRAAPEPQTPQLTLTQLDLPPNWQKQFLPQGTSGLGLLLLY